MKYAAYTDESIWSVEDTPEAAREEALATMDDLDAPEDERDEFEIAPISDELAAALKAAEETGAEVLFDLVDGVLVIDQDAQAA